MSGSETSDVARAKVDVAIGYEQRADAAAAAVLRRLLDVVRDNLDGAVAGEDTEYLHQLRIAVRRSRTVQRQLRGVFDALELPGYRADFRWLQRATGESRDLDVSVEDFEDLRALAPDPARDDLEPLRDALRSRQLAARAQLAATLRSTRTRELLDDWERLLETLVEVALDDRPDARRSIGSLSGERIAHVYGQIVTRGESLDVDSPGERFHALRKKGKELRYMLELFGARLFDAEVVEPLVRSLKDLQELLGRHQDREVQRTMLDGLAGDVAGRAGGPAACLAMGALSERLYADEVAARREFADAFSSLAAPERRELVARTFR